MAGDSKNLFALTDVNHEGVKQCSLKRGLRYKRVRYIGVPPGVTLYNGLYAGASSERGTFFRLEVYLNL